MIATLSSPLFRKGLSILLDTKIFQLRDLNVSKLFKNFQKVPPLKGAEKSRLFSFFQNFSEKSRYRKILFGLGGVFSLGSTFSTAKASCMSKNEINPFSELESLNPVQLKEKEPDLFNYIFTPELSERTSETPPSLDQKIAFFNRLIALGEQRIAKGKEKDIVVVLGATGSGKSLYIDYLAGCTIEEDIYEGYRVTSPNPPALVGAKGSCTLLPLLIDIEGTILVDTAGYEDTRGFEAVLANLIITENLMNQALSTRFIIVMDAAETRVRRGGPWAEFVKLFYKRNDLSSHPLQKNSLQVIMTHTTSVEAVKAKMIQFHQKDTPDLSPFVTTYVPTDRSGITEHLNTLTRLQKFKEKNRINLSDKETGQAVALGKEIEEKVKDLFSSKRSEEALEYVKFSSRLASIGSPELRLIHRNVERSVLQYLSDQYLPSIMNPALPILSEALNKFSLESEKYEKYVDLKPIDESVQKSVSLAIWPTKKAPTFFEINKNISLITGGIDFEHVFSLKNVIPVLGSAVYFVGNRFSMVQPAWDHIHTWLMLSDDLKHWTSIDQNLKKICLRAKLSKHGS